MIHLFDTYKVLNIPPQLEVLEPLFEPEPVAFSYDTPAWYFLGSVVLLLTIYIAILQLQKYRQNRYRRDALRILNSLNLSKSTDSDLIINKIRIVLKQNAIHRYGRSTVASLYGENWLKFLESKGKNTSFSRHPILINQNAFLGTGKEQQDLSELVDVSKKWIKTHA